VFFASLQGVLPGGSIIHRYNMKQKRDYTTEATRLAKAIDIAVEAFTKYPTKNCSKDILDSMIKTYQEDKENVLNPEPRFRSLASLKYIITGVFFYFNEASGPDVEYFWQQLQEQQLGYERVDRLSNIFERGKIRGKAEHEFAVDVIVPYQQMGKITQDQASALSAMIGEYKMRGSKR